MGRELRADLRAAVDDNLPDVIDHIIESNGGFDSPRFKAWSETPDKRGRALAARAMASSQQQDHDGLGDTLMEAMQEVLSGGLASSYVDPFTSKATNITEHERGAARMQLRKGGVSAGGMSAMGAGGVNTSWTDGGASGQMVPFEISAPVFTLRASSVVLNLPGIQLIEQHTDRMRFPRIAGVDSNGNDIAQAGVSEMGAITETTPDVDALDLVTVKFAVYHTSSSEFWEDASPAALEALATNAMIQLGLKIDYGMLEGTGASQLVGIRNTQGISTTSVAGLPADFDKLSDVVYAAEAANAHPGVWIMHPRSWNSMSKIKTGLVGDKTTLLEPDPEITATSLLGMPVRKSTQITLTEGAGAGSWIAAVDPSQLVVGIRRPPLVEYSRDFAFQSDAIAMRVTARYSFGVLNPAGISIATDVRAS